MRVVNGGACYPVVYKNSITVRISECNYTTKYNTQPVERHENSRITPSSVTIGCPLRYIKRKIK